MSIKAVYPGSFDPVTLGHVDIIQRLSELYQELIVLVANAPHKQCLFTAAERADLIRESLGGVTNVKVDIFDGLTVEYARRMKAKVLIRGLRAVSDFEYELAMAQMNKKLAPELETVIVFTRSEYSHVASRMVKEVAYYGGSLAGLVPEHVGQALMQRLASSYQLK